MSRLPAGTVWYVYEAAATFFSSVVFTVAAVFYVTEIGMSPLQLVLVGTVMEIAIFCFEVPTGVVADIYSRRLSIIIGQAVMGIAILVVGVSGEAWPILAAWGVWGIGYTFTSGAQDAWLADEVGEQRLAGFYLRGAQVSRIFALLWIRASVGLALLDLRLPILVGCIGHGHPRRLLCRRMPERASGRCHASSEARSVRWCTRAVRGPGSCGRPALLAILGIAAFAGMWSEGYDRLWQAHFLEDVGLPSVGGLDPVVWFGVLAAVTVVLSLVVAQPLGARLEHAGREALARHLFWFDAILLVSAVGFGLAGEFWIAVSAYFVVGVARNVANPLFATWLNRNVGDSSVRATVLSITNQADASASGPEGLRSG